MIQRMGDPTEVFNFQHGTPKKNYERRKGMAENKTDDADR
jgi:hypothetical protein